MCPCNHVQVESAVPFGKLAIKDRFDDDPQGCMPLTVGCFWNAEWSFLHASGFLDPDPFHRLGLMGLPLEVLLHIEAPALAVFAAACYRDNVHAARPCIGLPL